jgi:hypothetical protein
MKKLSKILMFVGLSVLLVSACTEDPIVREPSPNENSYGVYFLPSNPVDITVQSDATSVTYTVGRLNTSGSISVPLTSESDAVFTVEPTVSFSDGEQFADFQVTFNPLPSDPSTVKIKIAEEYAALYGPGYNEFVGKVKAINWVSLGVGQFFDSFLYLGVVDVEVLKAEGFNNYRIIDPYPVSLVSQDSWYGGPRAEEIEFWVTSGGTVAWDAFWYIGLNYSATPGQPIKAYLPSALAASQAPNDANSKFLTDKIVYFNPYYYIDGLGGYGLQDVYLSLPGGPDLYEYLGL